MGLAGVVFQFHNPARQFPDAGFKEPKPIRSSRRALGFISRPDVEIGIEVAFLNAHFPLILVGIPSRLIAAKASSSVRTKAQP